MECPKCKNSALNKAELPICSGAAPEPLACRTCGGMWIRSESIDPLVKSCVLPEPEEKKAVSGNSDVDKRTGLCPDGHGLMIRSRIDSDTPFYLERCAACGGIWFDQGEWQRLAEMHLLENLNEFWTKAWRRSRRRKENRKVYLETQQKLLGEELFERLHEMVVFLRENDRKSEALAFLRSELAENHSEDH